MDDIKYLIEHYGKYDEDARLGTRHGSVEFITTKHYIEKYIKTGDRIIEIGAGTGRYSHALARMGYTVDAVELVESNINIFKQNTQPGENVTVTQGNALDLSAFADEIYDVTLLLGPMYHLYNINDKRQAIGEAIRITKPGGIVCVAYCISDHTILCDGFKRNRFNLLEYVENNMIDAETFATRSKPMDLFELVRKEQIDEIMSVFPVTRLHYLATDGISRMMIDEIAEWDEAKFDLYLKYHIATCERQDMVGVSAHSLDIFRV